MSSARSELIALLAIAALCSACESIVGIRDMRPGSDDAGAREQQAPASSTTAPAPAPLPTTTSTPPDAGSPPPPPVDAGAPGPQCTPQTAPQCELGDSERLPFGKGEWCDFECDCAVGHFCAPIGVGSDTCCRAQPCGSPCSDACDCLSLQCQGGKCL
ncbi:MAG: hypothetical protein KC657_22620 [Myxococcales bacterium]|nr:hypothetical protein [Myxococcales bacterium]